MRHFRVRTPRQATPDECRTTWLGLLGSVGLKSDDVHAGVVAGVVPEAVQLLGDIGSSVHGVPWAVVDHGWFAGMLQAYPEPQQVGIDRLINTWMAHRELRAAALVIDCGTATTWDCVSADGIFLGGAIAPGVTVWSSSLHSVAPRLPRVQPVAPERVLGRSSDEALRSGLMHGYVALVDGMVRKLQKEVGSCAVIATGGWAEILAKHSETIERHDVFLTLDGLAELDRQQAQNDV